eukprot:Awhi_evm1s8346
MFETQKKSVRPKTFSGQPETFRVVRTRPKLSVLTTLPYLRMSYNLEDKAFCLPCGHLVHLKVNLVNDFTVSPSATLDESNESTDSDNVAQGENLPIYDIQQATLVVSNNDNSCLDDDIENNDAIVNKNDTCTSDQNDLVTENAETPVSSENDTLLSDSESENLPPYAEIQPSNLDNRTPPSYTDSETLNKPPLKSTSDTTNRDSNTKDMKIVGATAIGGGIIAGAAAPAATVAVISAAGFTTSGVAAGSTAAGLMSAAAISNGGSIAAGSSIAVLQSIGATGTLGLAGTCGVVLGGFLAIGGVVAGIGYGIVQAIKKAPLNWCALHAKAIQWKLVKRIGDCVLLQAND